MSHWKLYLLIVVLLGTGLLWHFSQAQAVDFIYVDNTASCATADGSSAHPWCSLAAGFAQVNAGQTLRIRGNPSNPYTPDSITGFASGTAASPIIVEPDVGHNPVIRPASGRAAITLNGKDYITIRNLTFDGTGRCSWRRGYCNSRQPQ